MDRICVAYEVVNHGIDNSQYFQGCGTTFTEFTDVATGCGDNAAEALADALENLAQSGWNVDIVTDVMEDSPSVSDIAETAAEERNQAAADAYEEEHGNLDDFEDEDSDDDYPEETYYYVSVRVREYDPSKDEKCMKYVGKAIGRLSELSILIHNAQTPSGDSTGLAAMRKERQKLENYLHGREVSVDQGEFTR